MRRAPLPERGQGDDFWSQLRAEWRNALAGTGRIRACRAGAELCVQDRRSDAVLILRSVHARVVHRTGEGEIWLAHRGPGDIVGEMSLVDGGPHSATVVTVDAGNVLAISHEAFDRVVRRYDGLNRVLLRVAVQRLRDADLQRGIGEEAPLTRLARLLDQDRRSDAAEPSLPRLQREIADLLGMSRASLVRALHSLRRDGIIKTGRGRITVLDPAALGLLASKSDRR
ncbi:Crp/Fnr family transcriptional regulator [Actinomadura citrea]|uniref:Crp/Fnr family transcriptional regulator n=1 Tax=Actinomadura citrea TaxID=46158 RepID=UPI003CE51A7D